MGLQGYLVVSAMLFGIGMFGFLARRNAILMLISIELMLNAVNLSLVAFNAYAYYAQDDKGAIFSLLVMAMAAMVDPLRIGITVLVVSRPRPVLQLLAFWLGGLAMGFAVGLGVLFLLRDLALDFINDQPMLTLPLL